jgi:hypothetical protein
LTNTVQRRRKCSPAGERMKRGEGRMQVI